MTPQLRTFRTSVQNTTIAVQCREDLEPQAMGLLEVVKGRANVGAGLTDGVTFDFGGAPLRLRSMGDELRLEQPDYDADEPTETWQGDVTPSLLVILLQTQLARRVGAEPKATGLLDRFTMAKGAGPQPRVYLQRRAPTGPGDSGWFLGAVEGEAPGYVPMPVYALMHLRPALLQVMALPEDYMAVFQGDTLEGIADPQNREVWKRS